jgi:hypothetical protein
MLVLFEFAVTATEIRPLHTAEAKTLPLSADEVFTGAARASTNMHCVLENLLEENRWAILGCRGPTPPSRSAYEA